MKSDIHHDRRHACKKKCFAGRRDEMAVRRVSDSIAGVLLAWALVSAGCHAETTTPVPADCQQGIPAGLMSGDGTITLPLGVLAHSLTDSESLQMMEAVQLAADQVNANRSLQGGSNVKWRMEPSVVATNWRRFDALQASLLQVHARHATAVLGMAASTTVAVVAPVAGVVGMPAVATAVTNRDTHRTAFYPTFVRACPSDVALPLALKDLVLNYVWHSVSLIYSTAFSGYHAVNDVIDRAPGFGVNVISDAYVEFDGTRFDAATGQKSGLSAATLRRLDAVRASNIKIIVLNVHGSELLAVLRYAKTLGMVEKGYAWIVLQFFASIDLLPAEVLQLLDGALVIRPMVDEVRAALLAENLHRRNPLVCPTAGSASLSLEAVYAYDAALAIGRATAAWIGEVGAPRLVACGDAVQVDPGAFSLQGWRNNSLLVDELRRSPPTPGAGGLLALGNDFSATNYDIFNVASGRLVKVGNWTAANKLHVEDADFTQIRWTGGTYEIPSTRGFLDQNLLIYVPLSNPFTFLLRNPPRRNEDFSGIAVDLLRTLAVATGFNYTLTLWTGSWTDMVRVVGNASTPYDMAIGSITVNSARSKLCSFSQSIFLSGLRILVRRPGPKRPSSFWSFFEPFHWTVWVVLLLTLIFSGFVITILDPDGVGTQRQKSKLVDGIFFSFMSFFFVHEADEIKAAWARIYLAIVQFSMLIIITSYTANMATFLSGQSGAAEIAGYNDLYQKPVACRNGTANWDYVNSKLGLRQVVSVKGPAEALQGLRNRSIVAYVADAPHIKRIASKACDVIVLDAQVDAQQYAFAFKKGSPWQLEVDRALGLLINQGKVSELFNQYVPSECKPYSSEDGVQSMTLSNLGGLFVLLAIAAAVTSALKVYRVFYVRRKKVRTLGTAQFWPNQANQEDVQLTEKSSWASVQNRSAATMKEPLLTSQDDFAGAMADTAQIADNYM